MVECVTCHGRYEPLLPDGTQYFHACPPLAGHELRQGLEDGAIRLSRADQKRLDDAEAADETAPRDAGEPTRAEEVLATIVIERPNKRDENIRAGQATKDGGSRIKAEGAGVVQVEPDEPSGPVRGR
jgi:hypothetical protein